VKKLWRVAAAAVAVGLVAWVAVVALQMSLAPTADGPSAPSPAAAVQPVVPASTAAGPEPAVRYPIEPAPSSAATPPDVRHVLGGVFGNPVLLSMFQLDDFPRRVVATVDNLGRTHAPSRLWPLNPVGGRFGVDAVPGGSAIGVDNAMRYALYVQLLDHVDLKQLVAAYKQLYPQLQQAYQDLGFPRRYFNDRVVQVIDQLLATPEIGAPLMVHLPQVNGPIEPPRPWILYEFDDAALESLSAGQRIMLRVGLVNERRLKAQLTQIRASIAPGRAVPGSGAGGTSAAPRP
jgi:hypothetical protein